jgi:hypothetical protein
MQRKKTVIALCFGAILLMVIGITAWYRRAPRMDFHEGFDWIVVRDMIVSGVSQSDRYSIEEIPVRHIEMSGAKIFFVEDKPFEALLGPMQAIALYFPQEKILDRDIEHLRTFIESARYKITSPEELLELAREAVPLYYGSKPVQQKILTDYSPFASGAVPITKQKFRSFHGKEGILVSYYAEIGPWPDILNPVVVLNDGHLKITIAPIDIPPRVYQ